MLIFIGCLLCAGPLTEGFACLISFNSHHNPGLLALLLSYFTENEIQKSWTCPLSHGCFELWDLNART